MSDTDVRCRHADSFTRECDSCYRARARYYWQKDQAERDDLRSRTATLTADLAKALQLLESVPCQTFCKRGKEHEPCRACLLLLKHGRGQLSALDPPPNEPSR